MSEENSKSDNEQALEPTKAKPRGKGGRKSRHNWAKLEAEWIKSTLPLEEFLRSKKIPARTGRRYLSVEKKNEILAASKARVADLHDRITEDQANSDARLHVQALQRVDAAVSRVLMDATMDWTRNEGEMDKERAGRLVIAAGDMLMRVSERLQAVPPDESEAIWCVDRGFDPLWYQRDFVFDWPSNLRARGLDVFIQAFIAGIGTGKTMCGAEKFGKLCALNRGRRLGMFAPTYRMLEDVTKYEFLKACARKGIPYEHRVSENKIVLWGDTEVLCLSMEKPDRMRGPTLAGGWIDEGLQMSTREPFDVIMGRFRDPDAKERGLIFTGTPDLMNAFNWAYDVLITEGDKNKVRLYGAKTSMNYLLPAGHFAYLEGLYDPNVGRVELGGEFVDVAKGRAYWNFERDVHVIELRKLPYQPAMPLILCVDFNVHPMHWVIAQSYPHPELGEVTYAIDEIYLQTTSTQETAREFLRRYGRHTTGVHCYGDAAGRQRHTAATRTDYQVICDVFEVGIPDEGIGPLGHYEEHVGESNPTQEDRIMDVNARFRDARGRIHLYITDRCPKLIEDLTRQGIVPGTKQLDKTNKLVGHGSDAIGYYINREHAVRRVRTRIWSH